MNRPRASALDHSTQTLENQLSTKLNACPENSNKIILEKEIAEKELLFFSREQPLTYMVNQT